MRLTLAVVSAVDGQAHLLDAWSLTNLGVKVWKERMLNALADCCVLQSRRDPRDAPVAEQALYEQLEDVFEACRHGRMASVAFQTPSWYQNLVLRPDQPVVFCAALIEQALAEVEAVLGCSWPEGPPTVVVFTATAGKLPGLSTTLESRLEDLHPVAGAGGLRATLPLTEDFGEGLLEEDPESPPLLSVLSPDAPAQAAHALAAPFHSGELACGHLERAAPLPGPKPADAGAARLHYRGQDYPIKGTLFVLGRQTGCDLVFDGDAALAVAPRHCEIIYEHRRYVLCDRSRDGTFVNDRAVVDPVTLRPGDWIRLGPSGPLLRFLGQSMDRRGRLTTALRTTAPCSRFARRETQARTLGDASTMQTRHRIPTIFNLSMVDVLCCALGCVILLWLVNLREAKRRARAAGETGAKLVEAKKELASLRGALAASQTLTHQVKLQLEETQSDRDRSQQLVLATKKDYDDTRAALDAALAELAGLSKDLKRMRTAHALITADLDKKNQDVVSLDARLTAAATKASDLEKQLLEKKTQLATTAGQADTLASRLKDSASQVTKLEQELAKLRLESKSTRDKLTVADTRATSQAEDLANLRKMLADANRLYRELLASSRDSDKQLILRGKEVTDARLSIGDLQLEKKMLEDRIRIARQAADNRFAGISLTGRRVVFLVDMSGSMDLIDEQTPAPDKWPTLCETLAKIMKSLPDLTHYQVILFSDRVTYALGNPRRWLSFDKDSSAKTVYDTLRRVKPQGGTNMAAAFAEAFQLARRGHGLALYVFSDSLPNMGDGLPLGSEKLSETEKTVYCSKYVRQMLKSVWNRRLAAQPTVRINAIGFFFESPDVGAFLWAMCRENEGSFVGMSRP